MVQLVPLGIVSLLLSCLLASMGGIGGGGLNVTVLLVIMGFEYTHAVSLSLCAVLGNVAAQVSLLYL